MDDQLIALVEVEIGGWFSDVDVLPAQSEDPHLRQCSIQALEAPRAELRSGTDSQGGNDEPVTEVEQILVFGAERREQATSA